MSEVDAARRKARLAIVEEHVKCENRHDLAGLMATFGADARYDDEPWQDHRLGLEGVRSYYTELLASLPDLAIDIRHTHVASDAIVLEVTIRGTHLGIWRGGMPATGRRVEFPLCGVFNFDAQDRLAGDPIGFVQSYVAIGCGDGWWEDETDPGVRGIDQYLCDGGKLGQGMGSRMVAAFVRQLFQDPAVTKVQSDPDPTNARAIRCYEKAGLHPVGTVATPDGPALLMVIERHAAEERASAA